MTGALTVTVHAASVWAFLGKVAALAVAAYLIVPLMVLSTMDSGLRWPWAVGTAMLGALVYGLWFA